ncbi:MAG: hypothetical protein GY722_16710, partial [bacterium]|nr:hypothetical protein [bacterium]
MIILLLILAASIPTEWDATDVEGYVMAWGVEPVTLEPGRSHYTVKGLQDCEEYEVSILAYRGIRNSEKAYIVGMPSVKLRRVRIGEPVHIGP